MFTLSKQAVRTKFMVAGLSFMFAMTGVASTPEEAKLREAGFEHIGDGVWHREDASGIISRVGFGVSSNQSLIEQLHYQKELIERTVDETESLIVVLPMLSALSSIQAHIHAVEELAKEQSVVGGKSSGTINGCTTGTLTPVATVSIPAKSASASVGTSGFGPAAPGLVRLGAAYANTVVDLTANYGSTLGPGLSVSASAGSGATHCNLFSFGQSVNIIYGGCGQWAYSSYSGSC